MQICLATTNPHKLEEVRTVFDAAGCGVTWVTLADVAAGLAEPEEDQPTFEGNAQLKARYYAQHTGQICLADDSGIEVDALGGRPGVHSARYSGATGPRSVVDPANNVKLLDELAGVPDAKRTARYVCAMCLAHPGDTAEPLTVCGELPGRILRPDEATDPQQPAAGRGANGFGYDPIVVLHDGRTAAEFTPDEKNAISHRGDATRAMVAAMRVAGLI